jgi:Flp pilus assembly protein TadD
MGRIRISLLPAFLLAAVSLSPQSRDADTICGHAVELHRSGDVEHAIPEYQKCLELRPDAPELRSNLGAALAGLGRYTEAIEQYQRALRAASGNPGLRLNLALA